MCVMALSRSSALTVRRWQLEPTVEVLPLGQRTRRGDSGMLCWLQVSGTGWTAGLLDGVRNETKGINAVKPASSFFLVPSLLTVRSSQSEYDSAGPNNMSLWRCSPCTTLGAAFRSREVLQGETSQGKCCGWRQSGGVAAGGSMVLQDHSPKQRW